MTHTKKCKTMSANNDGIDFINALPDSLLAVIVSLLPNTEGVRTCVLSHRWKSVWKQASCLSFDQRKMLKPLIQSYLQKTNLNTSLIAAFSRKFIPYKEYNDKDAIAKAEMLINSVLDSHLGTLTHCTIRHMPESCASGEAVAWMKKLVEEKKVRELIIERDGPSDLNNVRHLQRALRNLGSTLDLPFEIFSSIESLELKNYYLKISPSCDVSDQVLKTLTLKNVNIEAGFWKEILSSCLCLENLTLDYCNYMKEVKIHCRRLKFFKICNMVVSVIEVYAANLEAFEIDSVVCNPQKLIFETPKVQVLRSYCKVKFEGRHHWLVESKMLTTKEILDTCSDIQNPEDSPLRFGHIFQNLVTLCIDLDLKRVSNASALFSALKSSPMLQNLEVNCQVNDDASDNYNGGVYDENNEYDIVPYPNIFDGRNKGLCECIEHQLKTLCIRGFFGIPFEVEFLKYIITTAEKIKQVTVWFVDKIPRAQATETVCLLAFQKASENLSIVLNPGPMYIANVNGSFEEWVSTLRE